MSASVYWLWFVSAYIHGQWDEHNDGVQIEQPLVLFQIFGDQPRSHQIQEADVEDKVDDKIDDFPNAIPGYCSGRWDL